MTVPGRRVILAAACLALLLVGAIVHPVFAVAAFVGDALLLGVCLLEGRRLSSVALTVERAPAGRVQVDQPRQFTYRLTNRSGISLRVRLRQNWPPGIEGDHSPLEINLTAGEIATVALTAVPRVRGMIEIPPAQLDIGSSAGCAVRRVMVCGSAALRVFPSLRAVSEFETLRRHHAASFGGFHRLRRVGAGREYEQLREYAPDDDYRDINWKATARRNQPITTLFEAERSQDVLLCIDCGRMMGNPVGSVTALDHAIDAAITLAHVANRQGDRIGLALFRDVVHRFVKPASGLAAVHRIVEELCIAETRGVFPSYAALVAALRTRQNRRGMIFLFTDLNDPQLAANLAEVLPLATRRHVLVVISLRDPLLEKIASGPATDRRGVYEVLAARQLARERATCTRKLRQIGAHVLEADAGSLTLKLLNNYLTLKARQVL